MRARYGFGQADLLRAVRDAGIQEGDAVLVHSSMKGFEGAVLSVREIPETERFFVDALGFRKVGVDGDYHRYVVGKGGPAKTVDLLHEPQRPAGSWTFGSGTGHHLAMEVADDDALRAITVVAPVSDGTYTGPPCPADLVERPELEAVPTIPDASLTVSARRE